jgi:hypothetical protein
MGAISYLTPEIHLKYIPYYSIKVAEWSIKYWLNYRQNNICVKHSYGLTIDPCHWKSLTHIILGEEFIKNG